MMRSKTQYVVKSFFNKPLVTKPDIFLSTIVNSIGRIKMVLNSPATTFIPVTELEEMAIMEAKRCLRCDLERRE